MCNHCDCMHEMHHCCSILGNMPIGFCCEKCVGYENRLTCENYIIYAAKYVSGNVDHLKIVSETKVKQQIKEKAETVTPTINKER
ncbi:MAG: hypothetical protein EAX89_12450 [Candidatus Lokiarchaeota archaeon]|nr:hypothetical protein [Candidatus Lokiarchaeota archaeon]